MTSAEHHAQLLGSVRPLMTAWLDALSDRLTQHGLGVPLPPRFDSPHSVTTAWGEPVLSLTAPGASWLETCAEVAAVDGSTGGVVLFTLVLRSALLASSQPGYRAGLELLLVLSAGRQDYDPRVCQVFEVAPDESMHCALMLELRSRGLQWAAGKLADNDCREALFEEVLDVLQP